MSTHIAFPDMDLRQRLTAWKGYGVAELYVGKKSQLSGQTIGESGLREQDITVLEVKTAKGNVSPNPRVGRTLKAGDRLLCFGKLEAMRAFAAPRKRRRPRRLNKAKIEEAHASLPADLTRHQREDDPDAAA